MALQGYEICTSLEELSRFQTHTGSPETRSPFSLTSRHVASNPHGFVWNTWLGTPVTGFGLASSSPPIHC